GEAAQPVSLANLGLGPAVLSPGPNGPAPTVTITGLTSDAAGALELPFVADPSLVHLIFYFQALALDAAAPFGGVSLSESRAVAFGLAPRGLALAVAAGAGRHTLVQVFPGGALAAPIEPRLTSLALLDASLTNDNEMSFARDDRPVADAVADLAQGLRLADGSLLMLGVGLNHEARLLRVDRRGRIEALFEAQGTATELAFAPEMAVSAHDPYLALVLENPLPGLGAALLILVRTDGKNIPGSHLSFRGVATPGFLPESTSLCFLDGALFVGDGETSLHRVDLNSFAVTPVVFPASGAQTPIYVDETCAPAHDGSALAIGAGFDRDNHDVYCVTAAGVATNLTNLVGDYEDSGPFEADGMQLAMNGDGSLVAYMRTVVETETFVQATGTSTPVAHVTNAQQYINSIDTVVGLGFATTNELTLVAGQDEIATDVFAAQVPPNGGPVTQIANLSATSGQTAPVFGLGANLQLERRFTGPQSIFYALDAPGPTNRLQVVDATGSSLSLDLGVLEATSAGAGFSVIADTTPIGQAIRLRVVGGPTGATVLATWQSPPNGQLVARVFDPQSGASAFLVRNLLSHQVVVCDGTGSLSAHPQPPAAGLAGNSMAFDGVGGILVTFLNAAGLIQSQRLDPIASTWSPIGGPIPAQFSATFVR
ncbi:MAG: hypothetical protein KDB53_13625, partial [Planctomycetes bacterium]|nr:hypothetical protein [Planctomycetota bacterium]